AIPRRPREKSERICRPDQRVNISCLTVRERQILTINLIIPRVIILRVIIVRESERITGFDADQPKLVLQNRHDGTSRAVDNVDGRIKVLRADRSSGISRALQPRSSQVEREPIRNEL